MTPAEEEKLYEELIHLLQEKAPDEHGLRTPNETERERSRLLRIRVLLRHLMPASG